MINDLLRKGLERQKNDRGIAPYETPGVDLGACRYPHLDDISEVLAVAEGEGHGLKLCSTDSGFARFPQVEWINPLV